MGDKVQLFTVEFQLINAERIMEIENHSLVNTKVNSSKCCRLAMLTDAEISGQHHDEK